MTSQIAGMTSLSIFSDNFFVFLVNLSYWSQFQINIITGSGFMNILFYKELTISLENENIHSWDIFAQYLETGAS